MASQPQTTPKIKGMDIAGISIPAAEVGGDYFDYLNGVPDAITIIVGDVSGKGIPAVLYLFKMRGYSLFIVRFWTNTTGAFYPSQSTSLS